MGNLLKYDAWRTRYYQGATFAGDYEMPVIKGTDQVPERLIRFSDSKSQKADDLGAWVVPYEHDVKLECMWNNAFKYMDNLLEHPGIVSWDFSMYRNMPFSLQQWNFFRGRLIGILYEIMGGECIPNIRPTDSRSLVYALDGIPTECTIAMGSVGNLRDRGDRAVFEQYVEEVVRRLRPANIIVYGEAPDDVFHSAREAGIPVRSYPTKTRAAHTTSGKVA